MSVLGKGLGGSRWTGAAEEPDGECSALCYADLLHLRAPSQTRREHAVLQCCATTAERRFSLLLLLAFSELPHDGVDAPHARAILTARAYVCLTLHLEGILNEL